RGHVRPDRLRTRPRRVVHDRPAAPSATAAARPAERCTAAGLRRPAERPGAETGPGTEGDRGPGRRAPGAVPDGARHGSEHRFQPAPSHHLPTYATGKDYSCEPPPGRLGGERV